VQIIIDHYCKTYLQTSDLVIKVYSDKQSSLLADSISKHGNEFITLSPALNANLSQKRWQGQPTDISVF
jgi:hypothetical protein